MLDTIATILRDKCKLLPDRLILVGVSGGPDSLCLMELLRLAGYELMVAHYDHGLRPESGDEAKVLEKSLAQKNITFVSESGEARAYAESVGQSIEEAARTLRYRFLFEQAQKHNAQALAVGHTADDQVETVLMHLMRGAGLTGLKGMSYRSFLPMFNEKIPLVRPLLNTWREATLEFCAANGLQPFHDPSNNSDDYLRNRIRHTLIPHLESYNPRAREAIWRTATTLSDDFSLLNEVLDATWIECVLSEQAGLITFDAKLLATYTPGFQRNLLRRALELLKPDISKLSFSTLENATELISSERNGRVDLPEGLRLYLEAERVYVAGKGVKLPFERWPQMPRSGVSLRLPIPGEIPLSGAWVFSSEKQQHPARALEQALVNVDQFQAWLDADSLPKELEIRARQAGDRFEPLGMDGQSLKLSDFFINEKLPRRAREAWPLLCSGEVVIWAPGYRPAHSFRLTENTRQVVFFKVKQSKQEQT